MRHENTIPVQFIVTTQRVPQSAEPLINWYASTTVVALKPGAAAHRLSSCNTRVDNCLNR